MKRLSFTILAIIILSFVIVQSCSTEEEESVAPVVQTPQPEPIEYTLTVSAAEGGTVNNDPLVINYDTSKSYIGELVDFYPSAFFASDVPEYIRESVNIAIKTAADRYGKYGPVEFWCLGTEEVAAQELLNLYCERRDNLSHWEKQDCLIEMEGDFMNNAKAGRDAIQNGECRVDGSHSGGFGWGIHDMRTSYLMGFDDSFDCRPFGDDFFTIVHEYFHVVQLASVFNLSSEERNTRT